MDGYLLYLQGLSAGSMGLEVDVFRVNLDTRDFSTVCDASGFFSEEDGVVRVGRWIVKGRLLSVIYRLAGATTRS